jgi:VWFA-related protein
VQPAKVGRTPWSAAGPPASVSELPSKAPELGRFSKSLVASRSKPTNLRLAAIWGRLLGAPSGSGRLVIGLPRGPETRSPAKAAAPFPAPLRNHTLKSLAILGLLFTANAQTPSDANDLLTRGVQLIQSKPAEAVKLLQQALRLDPELPTLRYQLGLAFHAIGDEADAAAELHQAVIRTPDSAAARNYLGIALFQLGDAKAALEEFRAAAALAPKDPNAHFNLGEALARTGDSNSAIEELRVAATLAPSDAGLARLLKAVESAPASTIKVDVRQVLVPIVVSDSQGHRITGLTQADFKVFEDGVEQKIAAFNVESAALPPTGIAAKTEPSSAATIPAAAPQAAPPPATVRRTYMVLIDTLHTSFNNFVSTREALVKLFQQERSPGSQYVVAALGASPEMVLNVTPDPSAALAVFQSKHFQKIFLNGQQGGLNAEMERFRRDLVETRYACDLAASDQVFKIKCAAGLSRATQQSHSIAELDRTLTVGFLRQIRSLVAQLARARDRRTIVLVSDGFQIEPGREALTLVNAFFPPASHCFVPSDVFCPPDELQSTSRMAEEFEPILQLAAASNITIDTIDSRGLYGQKAFDASTSGTPPSVDNAVGRSERDVASAKGNTLAEIAEATGGTAFHDSNNLLGGLQRAFADGRDYYTIAYVSTNENFDGKFRAIKVQVRDPKALVNAKRGYWAAPNTQ